MSFALMNIGVRAMAASYAALTTTSHNISNVNTPGYSRQEAKLANSDGQFTGAGFFGQGVDVVTVNRSYDRFLSAQADATRSVSAADTAHRDQLTQLEGVFTTGKTGVGYATGQLLNAFVDVANNPQDTSARQVVISNATDLAGRFTTAGDQLSALQSSVVSDVTTATASVNALAKQIASLNLQISALRGNGQPPNDLLDTRDKLIGDLGDQIGVTTVPADDGSIGVFVGGGRSLVLGATYNTLKVVADTYDPSTVRLAMNEAGTDRLLPDASISGGAIAGQLRFQNVDLGKARNLLGQLAVAISGSLNQQQSLGLDATGRAGAPVFSVGDPRALPASSNTGDARLKLAVNDFSRVTASDYELRFDGSSYSIDRLEGDGSRTAVPGSPFADPNNVSFDGVTLTLTSGSLQPGDRFLLQPTAVAAQAMKPVLRDPNGLAAASPVTATFGVANSGTASLAGLSAVSPTIDGALLPSGLTFDTPLADGSGRVPFSVANADGSTDAGLWTPGQPIQLNGWALQLDGVPKAGDTINVQAGTVSGNNGNALAFAKLASAPLVGISTSAVGTPVAGKTITDAYAAALSDVAVRVQSARTAADTSAAFAQDAESSRSNRAGVSLDEEASKLIQFQQSYQAAAKVLQVAQSVFDTLLQTTAGR